MYNIRFWLKETDKCEKKASLYKINMLRKKNGNLIKNHTVSNI